tara:strand:+ start:64 stop:687 length:624 start_codon:yes stop_codon:yes gene_type:complete
MSRKPKFWILAKKELCLKDKKLARLITKYPKDFLYTKSDPYKTLARAIVGQQISVKAAQAVWDRFEKKCNNISPKKVINLHHMKLKSCGLSRQKITYLKCLSNAFIDKSLDPSTWVKLKDEEIISQLTKIKGIGRWTAEMYLIFNLCRPDVFPVKDIGVIRGICECYKLKYPIDEHRAITIAEKWKPWRSVAVWYLWRSLDPIPVEY